MKNEVLSVLLAFLFISCTQIRSGHFVKVREGESLKSLAKKTGVSRFDLERENGDKSFLPGEWVFIPEEKGILPRLLSQFDNSWSLLGHDAFCARAIFF